MSLTAQHVSFAYSRAARSSAEDGGVRMTRQNHPLRALDDVTVTIGRGSLTGLLGPNGCGKTTLLKLLAGVLTPDSGAILLDGRPLRQLSRKAIAREIAVVPQETHPAFDFTALEIVLMGRHPHLGAFEIEGPSDLGIARDALSATGTAHLLDRSFSTLSGGEKQRVVIASALAQAPRVLLLDEPTASLDLRYQLEVASLLRQLNRERGVTMVLATHDLNLAASICDSVVLVRSGRVLAEGATEEVMTAGAVAALYGVDADVHFHAGAGHLTVTPIGRTP